MKVRLLVLAAVGAMLVLVPASLGGVARSAANSVTFPDPVDQPAGVGDMTSVDVSNVDDGTIVVALHVANRPEFTPDMVVALSLDSDQNVATGVPGPGTDTFLSLEAEGPKVARWDGSQVVPSTAPSFSVTYTAGVATFRINARDLGNTKGFTFQALVISGLGTGGLVNADVVPDFGNPLLSYEVKIQLKLAGGRLTATPAKAGKRFTVSLPVTENDTGGPIGAGQALCVATLGGRPLPARSKGVAKGVASCGFQLPATAKGKTIRGTITVVVRGVRLTRSFAARVT